MRIFVDGVEIVLEDLNGISQDLQRELYERTIFEIINRKENAFFSDSFKVGFVNSTQVSVSPGVGFQTDNTKSNPESKKRLIYAASSENKTIDPPDASQDRIDLIVVKSTFEDDLTASRKIKDAIDSSVSTQTVVVSKDWKNELVVVKGTPGAVPAAPAVPSGYIKLAELYVTAVSGIANSAAITDSRLLVPVGSQTVIDTLGYDRLTAGSATPLDTLFADIDALLKNGYFEYYDIDELGAHPSAPGASKQRLYYTGGVLYLQDSAGAKTPVGSGGGGGGGLAFTLEDGKAPIEDVEFGANVLLYEVDSDQYPTLVMKVPETYIPGRDIKLYLKGYSESSAGNMRLYGSVSLFRVNNDPLDTPWKQADTDNAALENTVSFQDRTVAMNVAPLGIVDDGAVSPGDTIEVKVKRGKSGDAIPDTDTGIVRLRRDIIEPVFG